MRRALVLAALLVALPASAQVEKVIGLLVQNPYCGDGSINVSGEQCDGTNIGSHTCAEFSCGTGTPTCNGSCVIIATGCTTCSTGDLLDEAFTGSQTDGTTAGFDDATWTRYGDANSGDTPVPNPNATSASGCATGTGWAGDCLKFTINPNVAAFHDIAERNDFAATSTGVWTRSRLKITFTVGTDGHTVDVAALGTSATAHAAGGVYLELSRTAGPTYELHAVVQGGSILGSALTVASGDSLCFEMYVNSSTNTAEWWANGTSMGSVTDAANLIVAPTTLWLGSYTPPSSTDTATEYFDQVQVSSTGRLACN